MPLCCSSCRKAWVVVRKWVWVLANCEARVRSCCSSRAWSWVKLPFCCCTLLSSLMRSCVSRNAVEVWRNSWMVFLYLSKLFWAFSASRKACFWLRRLSDKLLLALLIRSNAWLARSFACMMIRITKSFAILVSLCNENCAVCPP